MLTSCPSKKRLRASGRGGVPPCTRRTSTCERPSPDARVYSAGREIRQAGRPPYPSHAVLLTVRTAIRTIFPRLLLSIALHAASAADSTKPRRLDREDLLTF